MRIHFRVTVHEHNSLYSPGFVCVYCAILLYTFCFLLNSIEFCSFFDVCLLFQFPSKIEGKLRFFFEFYRLNGLAGNDCRDGIGLFTMFFTALHIE